MTERQQTLVGVGHEQPKPRGGPVFSAPIGRTPPAFKLKGELAVSGTFLQLRALRVGQSTVLFDDCSDCGESTPHEFRLLELGPKTWGRTCLQQR